MGASPELLDSADPRGAELGDGALHHVAGDGRFGELDVGRDDHQPERVEVARSEPLAHGPEMR